MKLYCSSLAFVEFHPCLACEGYLLVALSMVAVLTELVCNLAALTVAQPVLILVLVTALGYQKVEFPSTWGLSFLPPADSMYEGGVCVRLKSSF